MANAKSNRGRSAAKNAKGGRGASAGRGKTNGAASGPASSALAELEEKERRMREDIANQRKAILGSAIDERKQAVVEARKAVQAAQKMLQQREKELHQFKVEAGLASPRSKPRTGGRTRKKRTDEATKKAHLQEYLSQNQQNGGVAYRQVRQALLKSGVFSTADLNSASKFGEKYLPQGWRMEGDRRNARVVKGR